MRNLRVVIEQMKKYIPDDNVLHEVFSSRLTSLEYCSPEMIGHWWNRIARDLEEEFGGTFEGLSDWQVEVLSIWNDMDKQDFIKTFGVTVKE
jgi:hypothetical protein